MGWFGYAPMDGDDGMDCRDEVFGFIGVEYDDDYNRLTTDDEIKELLEARQNLIYDHFRDFDWGTYNPGFKQAVWIQALAYLMCVYGARINKRGLPVFIKFIETDEWAKDNEERALEMEKLKKNVLCNQLFLRKLNSHQ